MDKLKIARAILSVTDKTGLVEFATFLHEGGVELVSTGGTMKTLQAAGLPVVAVSDVTGFPEMLDGRVKTLHPHIHAGVLADKDKPEHLATLQSHNLRPFDLVCVNLYEFAKAVGADAPLKDAVEQIDIGGPTLLRASAKNFHGMLVVPAVAHYPAVMDELKAGGFTVGLELRRKLAAETFRLVSRYDAMIADYLSSKSA